MKLAWQNLLHDRTRFAVTVAGIAFAVCLMVFQGGLLAGFLHAASRLVDSTQADLWVSARGVDCFDFPAPLPQRFVELSRGVPGVERASRIVTAVAEFREADGRHQAVALVGADPDVGPEFPLPRVGASGAAPDGVLVDGSNARLLGVGILPQETQINQQRARVLGQTVGFSSFLGCPYVFTSYREAARYLGLEPGETMFIALRLAPGVPAREVKRELQRRLPEADVWTKAEFAAHSRLYWIVRTGAGGAILTAAILGFLIGLVVVSQTIYATTMENLEEYATLKAIGASRWFVVRVVVIQALVCGVAGSVLGLAATLPLVSAARGTIAWITVPAWLPPLMIPAALAMCCLAAVASIRTALAVDPARVFRA